MSHRHAAGTWAGTGAPMPFERAPWTVASWNIPALERMRAAYLSKARRILGCPALAEDVVQDVMLRLLADPPQAEGPVQAAYVGRMVRNLAVDRARRRRFEGRLFTGLDLAPDPADAASGTPEAAATSRDALRRIDAAVAELPEPVRTAFRLHRVEGVPQSEVAKRLGVSRALVCGLVRRGHLHCLAALDRRCAGCPARVRRPGEHQAEAEAVGEEFRHNPAQEHALQAEERRQQQQRRDQREPLRRQGDGRRPARRADRLEQGRGGEL
ncbi:RNA polymerase sigma-70 factor (ECF subfamily) [Methylobacterium aerolatum]|uniref:RNA polymerase sigma-70 factor (ECF subfamily) n=1 Tax=Methylobacterium aerolatum TaxID=418708 RepID=A0ABU0I6A0_9HYPH|nr:RNA polymerase sigma-70 factor (ECF subfamily) [Methylobacterium aerolatum]